MYEIKRFEFEGRALTFRQRDGEWWTTSEEAAAILGHKRPRAVLTLADRNAKRFRPGEQGMLEVSTPGGTQRVRAFSPRGLARLCLLGRTEVSQRLHDWVIYDVMEQLRTGSRVVSPDEMTAAIARAVDAVRNQFGAIVSAQADTIRVLSGAVQTQASNAGRLLSYMSRNPEIKAALAEAEDERNGQTRLGGAS
jgi:prophage antirepressor-like protein